MLSQIHHQKEATKFLRRVADGALVSPLLLVGPSGVGKRFSVNCLLREILCVGTRGADCECAPCYQVQRNLHPDIIVAASAKSIQVDDVRSLISEARSCPSAAIFKAFIIDGADRFTIEAADALLKTLEEPPATSRFFLLAEQLARVPQTIRSRCGLVVYRPLPEEFVLSIVQRYEDHGSKALVYSRMGRGSVGQSIDLCGAGKLVLRDQVLQALVSGSHGDLLAAFSLVDEMKNDLELALMFTEQVIHDVLIGHHDPMKMVNVDAVEIIGSLGRKIPALTWVETARKIGDLRQRSIGSAPNLSFQLKTALAELSVR